VGDEQSSARGDAASEADPRAIGRAGLWTRTGIALLVVSALLWVPLPAVPFLPLSTGAKAALGTGLVVAAEIAFWVGAALAGPETVRRARAWIRGTLGRRR